ncbi:MAG: Rpn family recombination-promoting nuclease/putative transposase [Candidatus Eremiobacteraeota bacterium]|nr:Rpn family recombination-promoting nuclease/putative transposase [Candidatus Eremiobacteraeota bacterium]
MVESLDKELRAITREAEKGPRECDLLLQVRLLNGQSGWFYFQVEVQAQHDKHFARRVYVYNYRVFDRFGEDVCSLAILADTSASWRPDRHTWQRFGCCLDFRFPTVKLTDLRPRLAELETSSNPFAAFVSFHLWTQATRGKPRQRMTAKLNLTRGLYRRGLSRDQIHKLWRLLDWLMTLPPPYALQFGEKLAKYEQEDAVPYICMFEQRGIQKGLEQGRQEGLEQGLERGLEQGLEQGQLAEARRTVMTLLAARFGQVPAGLDETLAGQNDLDELRRLALRAAQVERLEDF